MVSSRTLALRAALLLAPACQPTEQPQELTPLSDASSAISADSAIPLASLDAGVVLSPAPASQAPTPQRTDASPGGGGGALVGPVADAAPQNDAGVASDSAVTSALGDAALVSDAALVQDAATSDSATGDANTPRSPTGTCGGSTPHGCWPAKAGNPMGCPAQIHEQSEYYPPLDEWVACESPYYERCNYVRPDGSDAYCACDLGVHWLCAY